MGEIISDAARLPGESREFFGILSLVSGVGFRAGAGPQGVRKLTANIALAAPFAAQSPEEAGRQSFRILSGQVSIGDNPLYAMLNAAGLLPGSKKLNTLPLKEKFELLDRALTKLAGNPFFREQVTNTLDVQWSTLMDTLFGPQGIGGQALRGPTQSFITSLRSLNESLAAHMPAIVGFLDLLRFSVSGLWGVISYFPGKALEGVTSLGKLVGVNDANLTTAGLNVRSGDRARKLLGGFAGTPLETRAQLFALLKNYETVTSLSPESFSTTMLDEALGVAGRRLRGAAKIAGVLPGQLPADVISGAVARAVNEVAMRNSQQTGTLAGETAPQVTNTFHVKIDLKTDDSPDAIALKHQQAMDRVNWAPRRARRGMAPLSVP